MPIHQQPAQQKRELQRLVAFEKNDSGVRRFDTRFLRWIALTAIALLSWHLWASSLGKSYLPVAVKEGDPAVAAKGVGATAEQVKASLQNVMGVTRAPQHSKVITYRLDVSKNTLVQMQQAFETGDPELGHREGGTKPYFKALITVGEEEPQRCKICLRGSMYWHHDFAKPSLRIKFKKEDHRGGPRYLELTRPEDSLALKNWLPATIARELGLMTENADHVRLFVNNKFFGVYLQTSRQGEPLALIANQMPGTFFKGDFSGDLWATVESWKTAGDESAADKAIFDEFLTLLRRENSRQKIEELKQYLDFEKYARWAAVMVVTGSLHTDHVHNHSYFYSGVNGRIEPIPWDCNSFGIHAQIDSPVDTVQHLVMDAVMCDPEWVHRRNQWIDRLINERYDEEKIHQIINQRFAKLQPDLQADSRLFNLTHTEASWQMLPVSVLELEKQKQLLLDWIEQRYRFLRAYLADTQLTLTVDGVVCDGSSAVRAVDAKGGDIILYPGLSKVPLTHESRPGGGRIRYPYLRPSPLAYPLASPKKYSFFNAITGEPVKVQVRTKSAVLSDPHDLGCRSVHPKSKPKPLTGAVELGPGTVTLAKDLVVSEKQKLLVHPGTKIELGPGVGIYCRGICHCVGTKSQPIKIIARDETAPWAAFSVFGKFSKGSRFEHCSFSGGSIGRFRNHRFKGMVNAYHCPDVKFRFCKFGRNFVGDDTVNLAKTRFNISNCEWRNSRADALDSDMSEGRIESCQWYSSGNDGLDMMTSKITLLNSTFFDSKDKGISVGEQSNLIARFVKIQSCRIGVQIKDDSVASFEKSSLIENGAAAYAYQKKWFYSCAGKGSFTDCEFNDSLVADIVAKKKSTFILDRSPVKTFAGSHERIQDLDLDKAKHVKVTSLEEKL